MNEETVILKVTRILKSTAHADYVDLEGDERWIPKSQATYHVDEDGQQKGKVEIPVWLKKKLFPDEN